MKENNKIINKINNKKFKLGIMYFLRLIDECKQIHSNIVSNFIRNSDNYLELIKETWDNGNPLPLWKRRKSFLLLFFLAFSLNFLGKLNSWDIISEISGVKTHKHNNCEC